MTFTQSRLPASCAAIATPPSSTALLNVAGVTDADADHETQTVQVECADTVTVEQLTAAVEGAGEKFHALSVTAA